MPPAGAQHLSRVVPAPPRALSAALPALLRWVLLVRITRDRLCASVPRLITGQVFAKPSTPCPAFPRAGAQLLPCTFLRGRLHSSLLSALRGTGECRRGGNYGQSLVKPCIPMPWPWPYLNTLKHSSTELERTNSPTVS